MKFDRSTIYLFIIINIKNDTNVDESKELNTNIETLKNISITGINDLIDFLIYKK